MNIMHPVYSESEHCDVCDQITTMHVKPGEGIGISKDKVPMVKHFYKDKQTVCLECSGLCHERWCFARVQTDPKFLYKGSLNAVWLDDFGSFPKWKVTELQINEELFKGWL